MAEPRWVIIVQQDQGEVYEELRRRLEGTPVRVVLDRRQGERRRDLDAARPRRGPDRRRGRPLAWLYPAVAESATGPPGPEASPGTVTDTCALCGASLEWELPRFPQPPARFEARVRHLGESLTDASHVVEVEAFTATGRPLLVHRAPARRRSLPGA